MVRLLIIALVLSSCSFIDEPIYSIDQEIEPYYNQFIEEGKKRGQDYSGADVIIYFANLNNLFGLHVTRDFDNVIEIAIDRKSWQDNSDRVNTVTVFHELGHALLYREHNNECTSIMASETPCKYTKFQQNRTEMLNELFNSVPLDSK